MYFLKENLGLKQCESSNLEEILENLISNISAKYYPSDLTFVDDSTLEPLGNMIMAQNTKIEQFRKDTSKEVIQQYKHR